MQDYTDETLSLSLPQMLIDLKDLQAMARRDTQVIIDKDKRANQTTEMLENLQANHRTFTNKVDELKAWTREELRTGSIDDEQAQFLANLFDFSLTKYYDVTIEVTHTFGIEVSTDDDIDDIISQLDVPDLDLHGLETSNEYSEITDSDYTEN